MTNRILISGNLFTVNCLLKLSSNIQHHWYDRPTCKTLLETISAPNMANHLPESLDFHTQLGNVQETLPVVALIPHLNATAQSNFKHFQTKKSVLHTSD